jgi:hypothetical protein
MLLLVIGLVGISQAATVLDEGTKVKVRTDTKIPAKPGLGAVYSATVSEDVINKAGQVAIPRGSRAQLVAQPTADKKDVVLDLRSVVVSGKRYNLTSLTTGKNSDGLGANKRTAKYVGGGAAVGAVLGAILGGGKGAAIGALVGGAGGAGAQVLTGRKKELPAETELTFALAQDLQMLPVTKRPAALKTR